MGKTIGQDIKKLCRFCTYYRPDARYRGVIGVCEIKKEPKKINDACGSWKHGKQVWLQGVEVEE